MNSRFLMFPVLLAGLQTISAADITGTIKLEGTPPPAGVIDMSSNPDCGKQHSEPVKTQLYVVGANNGLKDVVVYLKGAGLKSSGNSASPLVLDQKGCEYFPYVAAVQTGQKITVKNSDPTFHNVDVIPTVDGNTAKNKAQAPGAPDISMTFEKPENFLRFKCDVHPWMFSYVTIVDNPYFAVSDKDGSYKISNVPAGKYTVEVIHRKAGKTSKEIEVKDGAVTANFSLAVPASK